VWLSDTPLHCNEGLSPDADVVFEIELQLPEAAMSNFEWVEEGKPYREWLVPAAVLHKHATFRLIGGGEEDTQGTGCRLLALRVLQFLPRSCESQGHACYGSRNCNHVWSISELLNT